MVIEVVSSPKEMREAERQMFYLVGTTKVRLRKYEKRWLERPSPKVRDSVEVSLFSHSAVLRKDAKRVKRADNRRPRGNRRRKGNSRFINQFRFCENYKYSLRFRGLRVFGILRFAIQVATCPRKGNIPPEAILRP